jgi:hypothetical protein
MNLGEGLEKMYLPQPGDAQEPGGEAPQVNRTSFKALDLLRLGVARSRCPLKYVGSEHPAFGSSI